jgi:2-hydroxychromene-2-carboxylate isomerase
MKKVDFYFDFLSPYSYFAWKNHVQLKDQLSFNYIPVMMGKLFESHSIKGPGEIPAKRYNMLRNCFRYAKKNNIPFIPPTNHPFNPLYSLRLSCKSCSKEDQFKTIDSLWNFIWAQGNVPDDPEALIQMLNAHDLDGKRLIEQISSQEVRSELKVNTKNALNNNLFGVPSFVLDNELFWGNDSLEDMINFSKNGINFDIELFNNRTHDIKL